MANNNNTGIFLLVGLGMVAVGAAWMFMRKAAGVFTITNVVANLQPAGVLSTVTATLNHKGSSIAARIQLFANFPSLSPSLELADTTLIALTVDTVTKAYPLAFSFTRTGPAPIDALVFNVLDATSGKLVYTTRVPVAG